MPPPIPGPRKHSSRFGISARHELPYWGRAVGRRAAGVSRSRTNGSPRPRGRAQERAFGYLAPSFVASVVGQEATDIRRLLCFLQQETVVAVGCFDNVALDGLAQR